MDNKNIINYIGLFCGILLTFLGIIISFVFLIYGLPLLIIFIFILFNKKEDVIEQIKKRWNLIMVKEMIVTTGQEIPGKKIIKILGIVKGNTVRSRNLGRDIGAGLRNLVGGEVKTYTEMTIHSREEAYNRMINEAIDLKADAVIGLRFTTSMVMQGASEMLAYGTAVKLK